MIRILLVDDRYLILELLQMRLEQENDLEIVGVADNGIKAIEQVELLQPDVVLLDLEMPQMGGVEATSIISDRFPDVKIIVLSGSEEPVSLAKALKAGADGYLIKNSLGKEIADTIRFIAQGNHQIEPKILQQIVTEILPAQPEVAKVAEVVEVIPEPEVAVTEVIELADLEPNLPEAIRVAPSAAKSPQKKVLVFSSILGAIVALILIVLPVLNRQSENKSFASSSKTAEDTEDTKETIQENILTVETAPATPAESYRQNRFYTGKIVPQRTSELGFEYSGQIKQIVVEEGDRVVANAPLAYLDDREIKASQNELLAERSQLVAKLQELEAGARPETIAAAKATVRELQERLNLAQTKSQRRENLYAQGAISREQLDENLSSRQGIQARLDEAQSKLNELLAGTRTEVITAQQAAIAQIDARLAKLEVQQKKRVLTAPFEAIVSQKLVDEGTVITADTPILHLIENKTLEARIGIPVDRAAGIPLGSSQKLEIDGEIYPAKVTALLPEVDSKTRTVTAVLEIPSAINNVFPGQIAKLNSDITIAASGYWLPTTALVEGVRGLWYCYALGEKVAEDIYRVERREVEVTKTKSDRVLVTGTIEQGDLIITSGTHRIATGQLVRSQVETF